MIVYRSHQEARKKIAASAVVIGNFDGVHLGHRALFDQALHLTQQHGRLTPVVLTFSPHPARYFNPDLAPPLITTERQKLLLIEHSGFSAVLIEPFDSTLVHLSPEDFVIQVLVESLQAKHVIVGDNFVFGSERAGDVDTLKALGRSHRFETVAIAPVCADSIVVSSTKIREFILMGRVEGATKLLGRTYAVYGHVVRGVGRGKTIGIPTANLLCENELLPGVGVYVSVATFSDHSRHRAVVNVGRAPTFHRDRQITVEAHLLDFDADLVGQPIALEFIKRLRDEKLFSSASALIEQIHSDIQTARDHFSAEPEVELPSSGSSFQSVHSHSSWLTTALLSRQRLCA